MCITNVALPLANIDLLFRPCDRVLNDCNANVLCPPAIVFTMTLAQSVALFRVVVLPASLARRLRSYEAIKCYVVYHTLNMPLDAISFKIVIASSIKQYIFKSKILTVIIYICLYIMDICGLL